MKASDETLIKRIKAGDHEAFEEVVSRYQAKVYRLAYRMTLNEMDAEDVLQEVFLQVYEKVGDFRGESAFSTWLYKIALNATYMKLRRTRRESGREESIEKAMPKFTEDGELAQAVYDYSLSPEDEAMGAEAKRLIGEAIDALPEEYRAVLILRGIEGLSGAEASEILGLNIAAMKSRLHRARVFLRHKLEGYFKERGAQAVPVGHPHTAKGEQI